MDMVIVGSIGYDDIQTPAASGSDLLGGAAVYSGLAASFHLRTMDEEPTKVGLVGIVGDDFSVYDQMVLEKAGLNLAGVVRAEGDTFRWSGKYQGAMESVETLATEVNVLADFKPELPDVWNNPEILFCASTHPATQVAVLDQCPGAQLTVLDTFMLWIESEFETLSEAMRKVDIAVINEQEACAIADDEILPRAMKSIMSGEALHGGSGAGPGPRCLIVKRGSGGVLAMLPGGALALPAYPTDKIVDPTGCGDSFAGSLLSYLIGRQGVLNDLDAIRNALVHATVTSSFTLGGIGVTALGSIDRGIYHARVDKYRRIVGIS
ncbi:PfkB family carbohydrate kinase [Candidatus Poseidoniales archaeon]|nr:PfkB family carbohydrate kinase [Candidatus Poseidoniales archaeon]MDC0256250.1 PfkB family carbohydrate kinase [Candidatus Poseidoniales archaeon]|tara:strand:- start:827 stop:1792 length:966 start_codon:yes stop_codon:yes gene_type:complete